jgi:hypothetical protein
VLAIDFAYFSITGGRERWLYRVARKHAGGNGADGFAISMPTLFEKSGAEGTYRRFKFEILRIIKCNTLPGFSLSVRSETEGEPLVHMVKREYAGEGAQQEWKPVQRQAPRPRQVPQHEAPRTHDLPLLSPLIRTISEATIAQIRSECPGWDVYALQAIFHEWLERTQQGRPKTTRRRSWAGCASTMRATATRCPEGRSRYPDGTGSSKSCSDIFQQLTLKSSGYQERPTEWTSITRH